MAFIEYKSKIPKEDSMNLRALLCGAIAACIGLAVATPPDSCGEPILKPRKYAGPIPKRYFSLGIGLIGGAENEEMWDFLDRQVVSTLSGKTDTKDFGAGLALDGSYTVKVHPQFAFRGRAGLSILNSESTGEMKIADVDTSLVGFERNFDVLLFSFDLSGVYYFQDASVKNFQPYLGAGLGVYLPHSSFKEKLTNVTTGQPLPGSEQTEWDVQPGAHGMLGFLYHFNNTTAAGLEGRVQMAMSKFDLEYQEALGTRRNASFDVHYTGFILGAFAAKFF